MIKYYTLAINNSFFKQKHSTAMCSSVLIETVNYFVKGGSNVYGCFLDASKAFDKVHYGKLFSLLMPKGLPNLVVRFILDGYIRQSACIQWEGVKSRSFNTFNGVLFPRFSFLFTITT